MVEKIRVTDISDRERFWFYYNNQLFTVIHNCLKIFTNYIFFPYAFFIIKYKYQRLGLFLCYHEETAMSFIPFQPTYCAIKVGH